MESFETPILLLLYKRPEHTRILLHRLKELSPKNLYVFADGPKSESDKESCNEVRRLVQTMINWPCSVTLNYQSVNLGCKTGVGGAISWFFNQVEEGIILEDDCIPEASFFPFCRELLEKYRDDVSVSQISGFNTQGTTPVQASYFFSRLGTIWGWATWKRAWNAFALDDSLLDLVEHEHVIDQFFLHEEGMKLHRKHVIKQLRSFSVDSWVYYWTFSKMCQNGIAIVPARNLIQNIGFGEGATHTAKNDYLATIPVYSVEFPLSHPKVRTAQATFDLINYQRTTSFSRFVERPSKWSRFKDLFNS